MRVGPKSHDWCLMRGEEVRYTQGKEHKKMANGQRHWKDPMTRRDGKGCWELSGAGVQGRASILP